MGGGSILLTFSDPFKSKKGKGVVNILLKSKDDDDVSVQPTKISMKLPASETAARAGLLFILDCEEPLSAQQLNNWGEGFDSWTASDWQKWCDGERGGEESEHPATPLCYFEPDKDM